MPPPNGPPSWPSAKRARPLVVLRAVLAGDDSGPISNLAVEKMAAARAVAALGQPVALTATVKNTGTLKSEPAPARLDGRRTIHRHDHACPALEPGAETTVTLTKPFPNPGLVDISCQLTGHDDLSLDDSARFLLNVTESAPILVVEGESAFRSAQIRQRLPSFRPRLAGRPGIPPPRPPRSPPFSAPSSSTVRNSTPKLSPPINAWSWPTSPICPTTPCKSSPASSMPAAAFGSRSATRPKSPPSTSCSSHRAPAFPRLPQTARRRRPGPREIHRRLASRPPIIPPPSCWPTPIAWILTASAFSAAINLTPAATSPISVLLRAEGGSALVVEKTFGRGRVIIQAVPLNRFLEQPALVPVLRRHGPRVALVFDRIGHGAAQPSARRASAGLRPARMPATAAPPWTPRTAAWPQVVGREEQGRMVFRYARTLFSGRI